MSLIKCPNLDKVKEYVIPTKHWLKPIEKLIIKHGESNQTGILYITELINKSKILVKVSKGKMHNIQKVNDKIYNMPNIVKTYCTFVCKDNFLLIEKNKQFCNKSEEKYNANYVTLELMKKYNDSLTGIRNLNLSEYSNMIVQICIGQLNLFSKYGYTHNDIHTGNILYYTHTTTKTLYYKYLILKYFSNKLEVKNEYVLSDFDNKLLKLSYEYLKNIDSSDEYYLYSLFDNILSTIGKTLILLKDNKENIKYNIISKQFFKLQEEYEEKLRKNYLIYINQFTKNKINEDTFRKLVISECEEFLYLFKEKIKYIQQNYNIE